MTHVWTLKIRHSGEEDDVLLFYKREKAEKFVSYYFQNGHRTLPSDFSELGEYLFANDIGYFDIWHLAIQ